VTVHYEQSNNDIAHNSRLNNGGYGGAVVPVVPAPMSIPVLRIALNLMGITVNLMTQPKHQIRNLMATRLKLI